MSATIAMIASHLAAVLAGWLAAIPTHQHLRRDNRRLRTDHTAAVWNQQHDPLTGLLNRAGLTAAHTAWQTTGASVVVVFIDLDDFKTINDRHGHRLGDTILRIVGDRLDEAVQLYYGVAARLSGDEFAILLPDDTGDTSRQISEIIGLITRTARVPHRGTLLPVDLSASAGAAIGTPGDDLATLLDRADTAMYVAKHDRLPHIFYTTPPPAPAPARPGLRRRDRRERRGQS